MNRTLTTSLLFLCACASARSTDSRATTAAITEIVRTQEAAWNRGEVAGFMAAGYWRSPELTFFSGGSVTRGFEPVLARYVRRYQSEGREMGRLTFTALEVVELAPGCALARGRWDLDFESEKDVGGLFSLVFRRLESGWRIVHDHTSVDG